MPAQTDFQIALKNTFFAARLFSRYLLSFKSNANLALDSLANELIDHMETGFQPHKSNEADWIEFINKFYHEKLSTKLTTTSPEPASDSDESDSEDEEMDEAPAEGHEHDIDHAKALLEDVIALKRSIHPVVLSRSYFLIAMSAAWPMIERANLSDADLLNIDHFIKLSEKHPELHADTLGALPDIFNDFVSSDNPSRPACGLSFFGNLPPCDARFPERHPFIAAQAEKVVRENPLKSLMPTVYAAYTFLNNRDSIEQLDSLLSHLNLHANDINAIEPILKQALSFLQTAHDNGLALSKDNFAVWFVFALKSAFAIMGRKPAGIDGLFKPVFHEIKKLIPTLYPDKTVDALSLSFLMDYKVKIFQARPKFDSPEEQEADEAETTAIIAETLRAADIENRSPASSVGDGTNETLSGHKQQRESGSDDSARNTKERRARLFSPCNDVKHNVPLIYSK
jgi:hypothetical protein